MALDPDDPRPPYQQVAGDLRAAILSRRLLPGEKLPSGAALAREYGVARMTVHQAIRLLRDDSLVVTRQGSGVYVRAKAEPGPGVDASLDRAFGADRVTVDFAGASGEPLARALEGPLERVRTGRSPVRSLHLRILVPDADRPSPVPCRVDDLTPDAAARRASTAASRRSVEALAAAVRELSASGLVASAAAEVRVHPLTPAFRLYLLNGERALLGLTPIARRPGTGDGGPLYDVADDVETVLHETGVDPESAGSRSVAQARSWFDSVWTSVAREPA